MTEPMPSQRGHMPPRRLKVAFSVFVLPAPRSTVMAPLARTEGTLKAYAFGGPMCGCPSRLNRMRSIGVGVGGGADGGAGVGAHALLVDEDRRRQPFEHVDVGPRQGGHEALHEDAVGLVDQPLGLRRDRAEHQRALARSGDAGEHRQPALRELHADVAEVVHPRAVHADQVVAVGDGQRADGASVLVAMVMGLPRVAVGPLRRSGPGGCQTAGCGAWAGRDAPEAAQRSSWMRIRLPAGSRKAQSRTP